MGAEELLALASKLGPNSAALAEQGWNVSSRLLKDSAPAASTAIKAAAKLFEPDMTIARTVANSSLYDWDLGAISDHLNLSEAELNTPGFKILDVGAGSQSLAKAVTARGWASQVYSVEPRLGASQSIENDFAIYPKDLSVLLPAHPLAISALAQDLPFASGTFDRVVGHFSVPYYMREPEQIKASFSEMMRVLKPDGIGKFLPITTRHKDPSLLSALGRNFDLHYVGPVESPNYSEPELAWRLVTKPLGK